ncbi:MAG: DNA recombination protein RmuC [Gemmatimonadaceae bacterium]
MDLLFAFAAGLVVGILTFWLVARLRERDTASLAQELARRAESSKTKEVELLTSNMRDSVKALTSELITGGVKQLSDAARESLSRYTDENQAGLEAKKGLIDQSLESMNVKLSDVSQLVHKLNAERQVQYGELSTQLVTASTETTKLRDAADRLQGILSNPVARGQWGERLAEDVLRAAGLVEGLNYKKQFTMKKPACRPDFTFLLPDGLILNMDVKFPLTNYVAWFESTTDGDRERHANRFKADVKEVVKQVRDRGYINIEEKTLDYAILFVPNERVLSFIYECDPAIIDSALKDKVVVCSPFSLYAMVVVVRQAMDNFHFARTTSDVLDLHGEFKKEWQNFRQGFDKISNSIDGLQEAFDTLATTRRKKLDAVLTKIDALRGPERDVSGLLSAPNEESPIP